MICYRVTLLCVPPESYVQGVAFLASENQAVPSLRSYSLVSCALWNNARLVAGAHKIHTMSWRRLILYPSAESARIFPLFALKRQRNSSFAACMNRWSESPSNRLSVCARKVSAQAWS